MSPLHWRGWRGIGRPLVALTAFGLAEICAGIGAVITLLYCAAYLPDDVFYFVQQITRHWVQW